MEMFFPSLRVLGAFGKNTYFVLVSLVSDDHCVYDLTSI